MRTLALRRHTMRAKPGQHLIQAGVTLARRAQRDDPYHGDDRCGDRGARWVADTVGPCELNSCTGGKD